MSHRPRKQVAVTEQSVANSENRLNCRRLMQSWRCMRHGRQTVPDRIKTLHSVGACADAQSNLSTTNELNAFQKTIGAPTFVLIRALNSVFGCCRHALCSARRTPLASQVRKECELERSVLRRQHHHSCILQRWCVNTRACTSSFEGACARFDQRRTPVKEEGHHMRSSLRATLRLMFCAVLGIGALLVVDAKPVAACAACISCGNVEEQRSVCMSSTINDPQNPQGPWRTYCQWSCVTDDGGLTYHPSNVQCSPATCTVNCVC